MACFLTGASFSFKVLIDLLILLNKSLIEYLVRDESVITTVAYLFQMCLKGFKYYNYVQIDYKNS